MDHSTIFARWRPCTPIQYTVPTGVRPKFISVKIQHSSTETHTRHRRTDRHTDHVMSKLM